MFCKMKTEEKWGEERSCHVLIYFKIKYGILSVILTC